MRKLIILAAAAMLQLSVAYAEDTPKGNHSEIRTEYESTFDEFSFAVMSEYSFIDYVAYSVYVEWKGDAEAFIQWLKENPIDLDAEETLQ